MDLGGLWSAAASDDELRRVMADPALDDTGWETVAVPGHWRSTGAFADSDGPIAYRRRFEAPAPEAERRAFLTFDGIFYQADVWLDGDYLGDTEGYFFPHTFEVTEPLGAQPDHTLAVEVTCARPDDAARKRNLTGVFQHWDCIDRDWNPGGIWAPVRLHQTGPVWIRSLKVLCPDATAESATLDFEAELDTPVAQRVTVITRVAREGREPGSAATGTDTHALALGRTIVRWRVAIDEPELWWPHSLGEQPLYDVSVEILAGDEQPSDSRSLTTGLRQVRLRNFIATVNGERIFLKGANYGPARRALGETSGADFERDFALAKDTGLDLLRVHAHVSRAELYDVADRAGMLLWQDMPLQWGYGQVRRQAVNQSRRAVEVLGHHPSIAVWCGHNEPLAIDFETGASLSVRNVARVVAGQVLPTWNKTILDRSIRRALERADPSREVVAHSGIAPHPAWGTDSHFYFGWYHGDERDFPGVLSKVPVLARFVSEFGAQAVPGTADFMNPEKWPYLDWDELEAHYCLQKSIFEQRVPPGDYATFEAWRDATQQYQATVLRHHIETLRRLKYRPAGGFCLFTLTDSQPAVSWSILDYERAPKLARQVVADACAPVIVAADRLGRSYNPGAHIGVDIHAVSDLRRPIEAAEATATLRWPGGKRTWRFGGDIAADSCSRIGRISETIPTDTPTGELRLDLSLRWDEGEARNSYASRIS